MTLDYITKYFECLVLLFLKWRVHTYVLAGTSLQELYVSEAAKEEICMFPLQLFFHWVTITAYTFFGGHGRLIGVIKDQLEELLETRGII